MKIVIVMAAAVLAIPMTVTATGGGGGAGYKKDFAPGYYKVKEVKTGIVPMEANLPENQSADINTLLEENPTAAGVEQKGHDGTHLKCTCDEDK